METFAPRRERCFVRQAKFNRLYAKTLEKKQIFKCSKPFSNYNFLYSYGKRKTGTGIFLVSIYKEFNLVSLTGTFLFAVTETIQN